MELEVSQRDADILDKIHAVVDRFAEFGDAMEKRDVRRVLDFIIEESISHISDLVDVVESSELKAHLELELASAKVRMEDVASRF